MNLALDEPWLLALLPLGLLPLLVAQQRTGDYSWNRLLPPDTVSLLVDAAVRGLGLLAVTALLFGLAGLHREAHSVQRLGYGAHIVMLLDRSSSMDNSFAGRAPSGEEESKSRAAKRFLAEFAERRDHDMIGVVAYSTSPLFVLPLTDNREAIQAAIATLSLPGLAYTHISKGLAMALSFFTGRAPIGSRIILLVSDGAAAIDPESEAKLRRWSLDAQVGIYWIFLRTANSPGIFEAPEDPRDDNAQARPERYLHLFFKSLGIPYRAYEAENSQALERAIADIDRLENLPLSFEQRVPRRDLHGFCYGLALFCLALLIGAKLIEVDRR